MSLDEQHITVDMNGRTGRFDPEIFVIILQAVDKGLQIETSCHRIISTRCGPFAEIVSRNLLRHIFVARVAKSSFISLDLGDRCTDQLQSRTASCVFVRAIQPIHLKVGAFGTKSSRLPKYIDHSELQSKTSWR